MKIFIPIFILLAIITFLTWNSRSNVTSPFQAISSSVLGTDEKSSSKTKQSIIFAPYYRIQAQKAISMSKYTGIAYFSEEVLGNGELKSNITSAIKENLETKLRTEQEIYITFNQFDSNNIKSFLACKETCYDRFLEQSYQKVLELKADGIVIDFEYPSLSPFTTRENMTTFIKYINGKLPNDIKLIVAVPQNSMRYRRLVSMSETKDFVDAFLIMGYDFHKLSDSFSGPVSPLLGAGELWEYDLTTMLKDMKKIVNSNKLILGLPLYGYDWATKDESLGSEIIQVGGQNGVVGFNECANKGTLAVSDKSKSPYVAYKGVTGEWRQCHFENEESIASKVKLATDNGLLGVAYWEVGYLKSN